jgi:hypothetical protein
VVGAVFLGRLDGAGALTHAIGEEVAAAREFDGILCRANSGQRVQASVEDTTDHAFAPHRCNHGRDGDSGAEDWNRARKAA